MQPDNLAELSAVLKAAYNVSPQISSEFVY